RLGTVLMVEDNLGVAETVRAMLKELGYHVRHVENASNALTLLRLDPGIDIVMTDVVMPGAMNGLQLANAIRVEFPHLPVLLTSGYMNAPETKEHFPMLRKPYDIVQLEEALRNTVALAA